MRRRAGLATQLVGASCVLGALLLAIVGALLITVQDGRDSTERVRRAGDAALAATELRSLVVDLQAGQRGYLLTRQQRFLAPYDAALRRWRSPAGDQLVAALPRERELVRRRIDSLIADYLAVTIRRFPREPARVRLMVRSGLGKRRVDVLRAQLGGQIADARGERLRALDALTRAERRAVALTGIGLVLAVVLVIAFTAYLTRIIVVPVRRVARAAARMSRGDLSARVRTGRRSGGEVGEMAHAFNHMAGELSTRTTALTERYEQMRLEIDRAAGLQRRLLPGRAPDVDGLDLAGLCLPAASVGGDYFDYLRDDRGRTWLLVADVAGHGLSSALLMAMVRQVVRGEVISGASPAEVLHTANQELFEDLAAVDLFVTVFCVRVDTEAGCLEFANGGHNRPLLRRADGAIEELDGDGAALGFIPDVTFEDRSVAFGPGDALILFTDGVVEAEDAAGRALGDQALHRLAVSLDGAPAEASVARIFAAVREHLGDLAPADDVTVVVGRADDRHHRDGAVVSGP